MVLYTKHCFDSATDLGQLISDMCKTDATALCLQLHTDMHHTLTSLERYRPAVKNPR